MEPETTPTRTQRVLSTLTGLKDRIDAIVNKVRSLAVVYAIGAVVLWFLMFKPFAVESGLVLGFGILIGLLLLIPSAILGLFYLGLGSVVQLPERLAEKAGISKEQVMGLAQVIPKPQLGKLVRSLWDIRGLVMESKDMLLEYAVLLRLFNPLVLMIVSGAIVIGGGIVATAGVWLAMLFFYG